MSADITKAAELAESLRVMRRNAQHHWTLQRVMAYSITMDSTRLGDLSDAADMLEKLAGELSQHQRSEFHPDWSLLQATQESLREKMAEIGQLNAPTVLLTDEQVRDCIDSSSYAVCQVRAAESMSLIANGKAVSS